MKFIIAAITISLLVACTTNNFVDPAKLCATCKPTEKVTSITPVVPTPPPGVVVPPILQQQGWSRNAKSVLCGPPTEVIKGIKKYEEIPFMLWQDPVLNSTVMLFRNLEKGTLTIIENPNPALSCILSAGIRIHIEDSLLQQRLREATKSTTLKILQIKE